MILHDVAVTNDCQRMLCVGTLTASSDGLQPKKCRAEKQILGERHRCRIPNVIDSGIILKYIISTKWKLKSEVSHHALVAYDLSFHSRVPVLHDVRDITMARHDGVALVSYENKVQHRLSTYFSVLTRMTGSPAIVEIRTN